MPEGPEVRRYADALDAALSGRIITSLEARTREARAWLRENEGRLAEQWLQRVRRVEVLGLRWLDVDLQKNRVMLDAPKMIEAIAAVTG